MSYELNLSGMMTLKNVTINSWSSRIKACWLVLTGKVRFISYVIPGKDFYK